MAKTRNEIQVPIWQKSHLTIDEAVAYTGIGRDTLREIADKNSELVLWVGRKRLFHRNKLDRFLEATNVLL